MQSVHVRTGDLAVETEVHASCGVIRGRVEEDVHVFRGIPYAQSPVGPLRFAPPVSAPASLEPIDATRFGPISLQDMDPLPAAIPGTENNFYAPGARADEDCLSVNVWTADPEADAPVYVYIHGGAFLYGSGSGPWASGAHLAREHSVVVVTINYRLGLLGGLYLGDHDPRSSNLAIQDQTQALRWVRENIAAFGGDPARVTIGGESAGGMSVIALLSTPDAKGLFQRAVIESAHADATISVDDARSATAIMLERLHIDADAADVLDQLRAVSVFRLATVQREFGVSVRTFPLVTDDRTLPSDVLSAIAQGSARDVDLLFSSNREEDRLFTITGWGGGPRTISNTVASLLSDGDDRERAVRMYESELGTHADAAAIVYAITNDHGWAEPVRRLVRAHAASGGRNYHAEFAWASSAMDGAVGSAHLLDLPFFFGNVDAPGVASLAGEAVRTDTQTIALAKNLSASLAQFVRTGDLSDSAVGRWDLYTAENPATMILDRSPELVTDHLAERLDFWQERRSRSVAPLSWLGASE